MRSLIGSAEGIFNYSLDLASLRNSDYLKSKRIEMNKKCIDFVKYCESAKLCQFQIILKIMGL